MIVILGAGPTGLGAAYRLQERGVSDYMILERTDHPGGLASSYEDNHGFTWDVGGHVQFSHYRYYDDVLDRAVACGWIEHQRDAAVWVAGRWVPYPFQYNIHHLPPDIRDRMVADLATLRAQTDPATPQNFRQWIEQGFGKTMAGIFMIPYNQKVWGYPLESLGVGWMGERVAAVDVDRVRRNVAENRDDVSWGPNSRFRFPLRGGTGAIWSGVAALLPAEVFRWGTSVEAIDLRRRLLRTGDGSSVPYDHLVSTIPLDALCSMSTGLDSEVHRAASQLTHSSVHVVGIGLRGGRPSSLRHRCWMYFPEADSPYYRVTMFSNYSPFNVPPGEGYWSLMAEVCESPHRSVDVSRLRAWILASLRRDQLIEADAEVVSFWHRREEYGYPTPFRGRDEVLAAVLPALEKEEVYSRGRFGAWKYEVSNQDHAFMQGVEVVDRLLGLGGEPTIERPQYVNSGVFSSTASQSST